jgi:hypothetical protein
MHAATPRNHTVIIAMALRLRMAADLSRGWSDQHDVVYGNVGVVLAAWQRDVPHLMSITWNPGSCPATPNHNGHACLQPGRPVSCAARSSSRQLSYAQAELLNAGQEQRSPAGGQPEPSRRDIFSSTAASVAGACLCGVCGPMPAQAAMAGDWGYGALQPCAHCRPVLIAIHVYVL